MEVELNNIPAEGELPEKPSLDQLKKLAKELKSSQSLATLSDAQHELAKRYGFESWPKLKLKVEQTTLRRLIQDGEPAPVAELIDSSPKLVMLPFEEGDTPLHLAAEENRPKIVELLVTKGAKIRSRYSDSAHSPLSWALTCWSFDAANKLVELGDVPDLFCAAGLGDLERVKAFWPEGKLKKNPSQTGSSRYTENWEPLPRPPEDPLEQVSDALYIACRANRFEVSRWLLHHGADPNFRGYVGASCLAWAEFSDNEDLCDLLREHGGSDDVLDYQYKAPPRIFPIMVYAGWGFPPLLAERIKRDPTLAKVQTAFGTPLHAAAAGGNENIVKLLLACGANKNTVNVDGKTAADLALAKGHEALAASLR